MVSRSQLLPWIARLLKFGVSGGILAYLVVDASRNDAFTRLAHEPIQWPLLFAAFVACLLAVVVTIVRWRVLVRTLDIPFSLRDALRLGFLGFLFNFVSLGSVGGDLFKAIFLARERPQRRPESVASVVVDRAVGLYALLVLASIMIVLFGSSILVTPNTQMIGQTTIVALIVGTVLLMSLFIPGLTNGRLTEWLCQLPRVGSTFQKLIGAVRIYRSKLPVVALAVAMSVVSHALFAITIYLISFGLPGHSPGFIEHLMIVPLANLTGVLPLPMAGLGAFEGVLDYLYHQVATIAVVPDSQGVLVAFVYRAVTIAITLVSSVFYLGRRQEVAAVMHEAEQIDESLIDKAPATAA